MRESVTFPLWSQTAGSSLFPKGPLSHALPHALVHALAITDLVCSGFIAFYSVVPRSCMSPVTTCQCDQAYRNNGKTSCRAVRPSHDECSAGVTVTTLNESQVAANQASDRSSNNCRFGSQSIGTKTRAEVNTVRSIYPRQQRSCTGDESVTTNLQRFQSRILVGEGGQSQSAQGIRGLWRSSALV